MSVIAGVFTPATDTASAALGATTSTAEIVLGINRLVRISASGDCTVKFGLSGMGAAAATDIPVWGKTYQDFFTGEFDRIRIFNTTAGSVNYFIVPLVR
jgi:hypothetical protein